MNMAATFGTLLLPVLYAPMGGWVLAIAGVVTLAGVVWAAPVLRREWACLVDGGKGVLSCADAERLQAGAGDQAQSARERSGRGTPPGLPPTSA